MIFTHNHYKETDMAISTLDGTHKIALINI